ncbi:hypothetical protein FOS14_05475 [Skermania sp. ID1734]|nr:hypothetical protein [Skermania sp. ID1734]TSE01283.1 hypothetical protein FOS14_05475 [Skermania sp. ID1734]
MARRLGLRRPVAPQLDPDRSDLVVVAACFDDAAACSTVLAEAAETAPRWVAEAPAVLRHHLRLPAGAIDSVSAIAAQDGYRLVAPSPADAELVLLQRVQVLDALHCSQERSRMAGLAQRYDGDALGWDALQPDGAS